VLIDQEAIYAPRHGSDRLLLGLKGSLNENELDLWRSAGRRAALRDRMVCFFLGSDSSRNGVASW
jgi:hypothetical protein